LSCKIPDDRPFRIQWALNPHSAHVAVKEAMSLIRYFPPELPPDYLAAPGPERVQGQRIPRSRLN